MVVVSSIKCDKCKGIFNSDKCINTYCLKCYSFLNSISYHSFENISDIFNDIYSKIDIKNNYFNFYYRFENEVKYNKRNFKFKKLNFQKLYADGWEIHSLKTTVNSRSIFVFNGSNFSIFSSISCTYIYLPDNKILLKLYDVMNMNNLKLLKHYINEFNLELLNPFLYLYDDRMSLKNYSVSV